jgi:TonB family protein
MTPITTESRAELEHQNESRAGTAPSSRTQPVSVEIPVLVRGSRRVASVPGQPGKLEHFSEETTTVVVFAQGAVVRLVGSAKAGQLVGLTNRQTGKEALCRIVNIKHFQDTRGYVEIEFNHPMNGFWQAALPQEAPAAPKKNGSSPLDSLGEVNAEQVLRANPKEVKAQPLEMAALLKEPVADVAHEPSVAPATPQGFWKSTVAPEEQRSAASREQVASADARVAPAKASSELAAENSEAAAPLVEIAEVTEVAAEQAGASSLQADLEVSEIGVSEFELATSANDAAVAMEDVSMAAEAKQENAEASSPAGEWPLPSAPETLVTQPEISSGSSHDGASFAANPPPAAAEELNADLESLLQPLNGLAEPSAEAISTQAQIPEPSSVGETHVEAHQRAAASSPLWQSSEEPEHTAPPVENLEQDGLSPEDMWNAGSIVHSNLDRPSAGSSDADMRASDEKTLENARLAELKAALVTPSAAAAMRENDSLASATETDSLAQPLSLESVWSLFRSLNKSVPSTPPESADEAASFKLFASGAISDARLVAADSARAAESLTPAAELRQSGEKENSSQETRARGAVPEVDDSDHRSESEEKSEASQESAANHPAHAADSDRDEDAGHELQGEVQAAEEDDHDEEEDSWPQPSQQDRNKTDVVPQWYSANASSAASKPWTTPGSAGANSPSSGLLSGASGTMAITAARRSTGAKSILAHAAATLVLLAAGAAAFHTLRPSVSYLMKAPAAPPAVDANENATARDAAVASLSVPPLPADIQAQVAKNAPAGNAKPSVVAPGRSGAVQGPVPGDTSAPLRVGDGVKAPRVLTKTLPVVPEAALASGTTGDVVLSVVVDTAGRVVTARVVSGPAALRNAALEAVRQWDYEPALQDGRPVAVQIFVTVNFPSH